MASTLDDKFHMSSVPPDDQFVRNLTANQHRLYGLILSLLPNPESARDVLQETNVVMWRKANEFTPGTNFAAWSAKIAYLQVMAFRATCGRDRHVFDDSLLETLADEATANIAPTDERLSALEACLEKMPVRERDILMQRYAKGGSVKDLAAGGKKSVTALRVALFRLRHALLECIERRLGDSAPVKG